MDNTELLRRLDALAHLESDAIAVYSEALQQTTDRELRDELGQFLLDHMRHADAISDAIVDLGGQRPEERFDAVGRFLHWPTMVHAHKGTDGALAALTAAEHYHSVCYADAACWDVDDPDVEAMLAAFSQDEQREREFVQQRAMVGGEGGRRASL